jgi:hypothetical protein
VEDWDVEPERPAVKVRPVHLGVALAGVVGVVLFLVVVGVGLRAARHPVTFAVPEGSAETASVSPEDQAAAEEAARILLGGGLIAVGPNRGHLGAHETARLRDADTEVRVTPGRVTLGSDACAPGPLLTVELTVEGDTAAVGPADFYLISPDGVAVEPEPACSDDVRRLVFATSEPGRLAYGPDRAAPGAAWDLRG